MASRDFQFVVLHPFSDGTNPFHFHAPLVTIVNTLYPVLRCTDVEMGKSQFLEVTVQAFDGAEEVDLSVPTHLVLFIQHRKTSQKPIGFVYPSKSDEKSE
jgi:hypothetical protein